MNIGVDAHGYFRYVKMTDDTGKTLDGEPIDIEQFILDDIRKRWEIKPYRLDCGHPDCIHAGKVADLTSSFIAIPCRGCHAKSSTAKHSRSQRSCEIATLLTEFVTYEDGKKLRAELHSIALREYQPRHTANEYLAFMNRHVPTFDLCGTQSTNHPWYMSMFTIISQHVYGDCVEECLDTAMENVNA